MFVLKIDIDLILLIITFIMMGITILYIFLDVHYFLRTIFTMWSARLFQSEIKLNDTGIIYGMCTTNDVDVYWQQMNNARYVRELDFARLQFCERTGLYSAILNTNGILMQNSTYIQYRRPILLFSPYKITTKLMYWDEEELYLEHQFITLKDDFVCAAVISRQSCVGLDLHELICTMLNTNTKEKPKKPKELIYLGQCSEVSNTKIRKLSFQS